MKSSLILLLIVAPALSPYAQTILMNFDNGNVTGQPETWNNFTSTSIGIISNDLLDTTNTTTGIQLEVTNGFYGVNSDGTNSPTAPYPAAATGASFYDANTNWDPSADATAVLEFTGLDPNKTYNFTFYASRMNVGDIRTTLYTVDGMTSDFGVLDAANNVDNTLTVGSIAPTLGGLITLTLTPDDSNSNGNQFIYLGVAELTVIPEPSTYALLAGALGLCHVMLRRRKVSSN